MLSANFILNICCVQKVESVLVVLCFGTSTRYAEVDCLQ